jgi:hypothetical protein
MRMYRGDLRPDLVITLRDGKQTLDLTHVDAIHVIGYRNNALLFRRAVTGSAQGVVSMEWQSGDTDIVGRIEVEVEVTWAGNKPQTFRPVEVVDIVKDYG